MYKHCLACHFEIDSEPRIIIKKNTKTTYYCYFLVLLFMRYFQVKLLFCDPSCQSDSLSLRSLAGVLLLTFLAPQTSVGSEDRPSVSVVCTQEFEECASKVYPVAIVTIGLLLKYLSEERRKN